MGTAGGLIAVILFVMTIQGVLVPLGLLGIR
jgi:hypothetical protein